MNILDLLFGRTKSDHIYVMILPSLCMDPFLIITFSCGSRSMHPTGLSSCRSIVSLKMLGQKSLLQIFHLFFTEGVLMNPPRNASQIILGEVTQHIIGLKALQN